MKILLIGSGAREHAIARAIKRSPQKTHLTCLGSSINPGIEILAQHYEVGSLCDISHFLKQKHFDFAIIGPEAPLAAGVSDFLWEKYNIPTIGPRKELAQLETSKTFTRDLLAKNNILGNAVYKTFHNLIGVKDFLMTLGENNYVIKADGLMGGKGVKVGGEHLNSIDDAYHFCQTLHDQNFSFLIEEKFIGQEFSLMCFCDGETLIPMPLVQDHKRAFIDDLGPNTGGMGSYSDANHLLPFISADDFAAAQKINVSVIRALTNQLNAKYQGILYGSFIATKTGVKLIEYNARFGDPEALNVLAILETDFVDICQAIIQTKLYELTVKFAPLATVCKYVVPEGYPDHPVKNELIDFSNVKDPNQLYFGAIDKQHHQLIATGSRAAAIVAVAPTISEAEKKVEAEIQLIKGKIFHRPDIGTEVLIQKRIQQMQQLREKSYSGF